ncbi:MAG: tryptophan synthase subunit alpha [Candidatus Dormibacteraeota bacterium]|nr:tryptophan synthase subunit alpha [Candidatus Dormibacteraeota bacterium]
MSVAAPGTRFADAFAARETDALPGLIPYFTAGFPALESTVPLLIAAQETGCLAAEVGIPFSDPLADGPTIQRSGTRALRNGMTLHIAVRQIRAAREAGVTIPLAPMTYVNPILAYGPAAFMADLRAAGADGLIVPDLPDDEAGDVRDVAHAHGLAFIPLVAPTTTGSRLAHIAAHASGFVYCVAVTGVTGARAALAAEALQLLDRVRACTPLPRALGFGLRTHEHLEQLRGHCEAAAVGSALIDAIERDEQDAAGAAARFLRSMLHG